MAVAAGMQGDLHQAERLHRRALAASQSMGSVEGAAFTEACLGCSLANAAHGSERRAMALAVEGSAGAHAACGDAMNAARLLGVAATLRGEQIVWPR